MSAGLFPNGSTTALAGLAEIIGPAKVVLLRAWPQADAEELDELVVVPSTALQTGQHPVFGASRTALVDGVRCIENAQTIVVGRLVEDASNIVGWAVVSDGKPTAWGPLVNASGAEITRSFSAGDELAFLAGALRIGLA